MEKHNTARLASGLVTAVQVKSATLKTPIASSISAQKATIHQSVFDALPDSAFIREAQLVQSPKRPDTPAPPALFSTYAVAQSEGRYVSKAHQTF